MGRGCLQCGVCSRSPAPEVNRPFPLTPARSQFFVGVLILEYNIPAYWAWFRYLAFFRYTWRGLMVSNFRGADPILFPNNGDRSTTLQFYNLSGVNEWAEIGYLSIFTVGYAGLAWLAMGWVRHEKR